ncbi:preprotein translocase subunit SecA [Patescibacteria group bacterium]|nr:preprotein translocase subunit SecA [Patescibacteria group bacterium]
MSFYTKVFGDPNVKILKEIQPLVVKINDLEKDFEKLSEAELKGKTVEFKDRLKKGETLDEILPEAFATVREASRRTTGMRHFDVQLVGGIVLHQGRIAEMRTGEGKTLVATLPVYLNALEGRGVHLVTVNDYLAKRDAVWMGQIYDYLGLSVGIIQNQRISYIYDSSITGAQEGEELDKERDELGSFKVEEEFLRPASRQEAYRCDITYGTNNEFGFDYLRDNMVQSVEEMVMRPGDEMHYAIIDEVDSILVDEARTPLIISAPAQQATDQYYQFAKLVKQLKENDPLDLSVQGDYNVDEKMRSATLTEGAVTKFEKWLNVENLYVEGGIRLVHHVEQALKAEVLFKCDKDYIVENGELIIIDEFTGRKMPGRRYSEGLHQALEAKEGLDIQRESQTLATVTFQNLFRMYDKLSGMTGTAVTESEEFVKIYNLEVVVIPTNRPDVRIDQSDRIYKTERGKYKAVIEKIKECRAKGQPVLVGTISVEKNEELSEYLLREGVEHEALNAKNHEREGEIVAQAGRPGAVTLATNMAGRGVDIKLGGVPANPEDKEKVIQAGGLFVLGTERHESRRIDNQLRGRSARQGDPGETQFFVSTDDDLMRIFAGDRLKNVMERLKVPEDMPIEQKMITKMLEGAQKKVEGHNFDIRKHLLEYDDVLNKHREVIYKKRRQILELSRTGHELGKNSLEENYDIKYKSLQEMILDLIEQEIEFVVSFHTNTDDRKGSSSDSERGWNLKEVYETVRTIFSLSQEDRDRILHMGSNGDSKLEDVEAREKLVKYILERASQEYIKMEEQIVNMSENKEEGKKMMKQIEKGILLRSIDNLWVDHLVAIDYLRTGIGLRGYGQRDPLVEYKKETYRMFNELLSGIQKEVVFSFYKVSAGLQIAPTIMANDKLVMKGAQKSAGDTPGAVKGKTRNDEGDKVGRNDPCPCGSGKKYKKCCGA